MWISAWLNLLSNGKPINLFEGKSSKVPSFYSFPGFTVFVLNVYLLLAFAVCGFCKQVPLVSVPLGFEVSGLDRTATLVSQNGVFAFGFLQSGIGIGIDNGDDDGGVIVGIRYNLGKESANVPVWTVGGGIRVSENSTFRLSEDGRLVLLENPGGLVVWSSNTSDLGVQKATLLDNGNLVLLGSKDELLWQSFHSPTHSLLPGQSICFPQSLRAASSKSISSYYNLLVRRSGDLALVWESNVTYWKSSQLSSSSNDTMEARFDSNGVLGLFGGANRSVWSVASKDVRDPSVTLRHLRIDPDGNLRIYSWDNVHKTWKVGWQAVENQCDVFGSCGLYSVCGFESSAPVCNCLYDDSTDNHSVPPGTDLGFAGCKKLVDLSNCKQHTSMMVLKHTSLYGLYPSHDTDVMLNENDCRNYCSNDTSCVAVTSRNDGSGICTVKKTSFLSGYSDPSLAAISFLKVCLLPQAVSARKSSPLENQDTVALSSQRFIAHTNGNKFVAAIALIGLTTALGCLTLEILVFWYIYQRRKSREWRPFVKNAQTITDYSALTRLSFEEVKELTASFAYQLGTSIFRGLLPNQTAIIVKLLDDVVVSEKEFRTTVSVLGGTHHKNLVALKGFCYDQKHKALIYEYVPHGSLDRWLFDEELKKPKERGWQERLDIALGVARALAYLHVECQSCIPHGNLKLENTLLDEKLVPKLMDYGLQALHQEKAALSSESPSEKDIYNFGQILLQIATCRKDVPADIDVTCLVDDIVEKQRLEGVEEYERVERVVKIAIWCMQNQPFLRPSISEVLKVLEGTLSVDRPPSSFPLRLVREENMGSPEIVEAPES